MGKLFLMCGIPGSGKSTWLTTQNGVIISRDAIRFALLKDEEDYFAHEDEVYKIFIEEIRKAMLCEPEVYVDATHLTPRSRRNILRELDLTQVEEVNCIAFDIPLEEALRRNANRSGRACVPQSAIINMYKAYKLPIYEEGFNHITIIDINGKEKEL
jgi:2',3'-cyclic-nucleotide 3'-phosphodiesterase